VLVPSDEAECRRALTTAYRRDHPAAVRYPRGSGAGVAVDPALDEWPWGQGVLRRQSAIVKGRGTRIAILAFGPVLHAALAAADKLDATVADMRFAKPLDARLVDELARSHDAIVTIEEGCIAGGAGSAVLELLQVQGHLRPVLMLGIPDEFTEHGDPVKLMSLLGLDAAGIEQSIAARFGPRLARVADATLVANS
jgi:1-deoxy-D-xylulose-5-phosphate synthase